MTEFSFKYCRVCGGDIELDAQTCPLCSSRQEVVKNYFSIGFIIFLAIAAFIAIILLGIASARAIPQFIRFRTNTSNAIAVKSVRVAQSRLEEHTSCNGRYPNTLDHFYPYRTVV
jgi:RNA polymerase subunit RPABC4/transcription elongation factor Spt4